MCEYVKKGDTYCELCMTSTLGQFQRGLLGLQIGAALITPLNGLGPEYKNCTASGVCIALDDSDTL